MFYLLTDAFNKFFNITGYATRSQFWMTLLQFLFVYVVLALVAMKIIPQLAYIGVAFAIIFYIPIISITVRRFNDAGSNINILLLLTIVQQIIPLLFIAYLYFLCKDSVEQGYPEERASLWQKIAFTLIILAPFISGLFVAKQMGLI